MNRLLPLPWPEPNRRLGFVDALAVTGLVGFLVARFIPVARLPFWGCAFRDLTGWPCLGCGLTRVADRMSHFNFLGALEANPLGAVAAFAFMVAIVWSLLHLVFKVPYPNVQLHEAISSRWRMGLLVAVVVNWGFMAARMRLPDVFGGG